MAGTTPPKGVGVSTPPSNADGADDSLVSAESDSPPTPAATADPTRSLFSRFLPYARKALPAPGHPVLGGRPSPYAAAAEDFLFDRWLQRYRLEEIASSDGGVRAKLRRVFVLTLNALGDFPQLDRRTLEIDESVNLGAGRATGLGRGKNNLGVFRARIGGSAGSVVVKLIPEDSRDVFEQIRNQAIVSSWDAGPLFHGFVRLPERRAIGLVMDEIVDGINTAGLRHHPQEHPAFVKRLNPSSFESLANIRLLLRFFSSFQDDVDLMIDRDGIFWIHDAGKYRLSEDPEIGPSLLDNHLVFPMLKDLIPPQSVPIAEQERLHASLFQRQPNAVEALRLKGFFPFALSPLSKKLLVGAIGWLGFLRDRKENGLNAAQTARVSRLTERLEEVQRTARWAGDFDHLLREVTVTLLLAQRRVGYLDDDELKADHAAATLAAETIGVRHIIHHAVEGLDRLAASVKVDLTGNFIFPSPLLSQPVSPPQAPQVQFWMTGVRKWLEFVKKREGINLSDDERRIINFFFVDLDSADALSTWPEEFQKNFFGLYLALLFIQRRIGRGKSKEPVGSATVSITAAGSTFNPNSFEKEDISTYALLALESLAREMGLKLPKEAIVMGADGDLQDDRFVIVEDRLIPRIGGGAGDVKDPPERRPLPPPIPADEAPARPENKEAPPTTTERAPTPSAGVLFRVTLPPPQAPTLPRARGMTPPPVPVPSASREQSGVRPLPFGAPTPGGSPKVRIRVTPPPVSEALALGDSRPLPPAEPTGPIPTPSGVRALPQPDFVHAVPLLPVRKGRPFMPLGDPVFDSHRRVAEKLVERYFAFREGTPLSNLFELISSLPDDERETARVLFVVRPGGTSAVPLQPWIDPEIPAGREETVLPVRAGSLMRPLATGHPRCLTLLEVGGRIFDPDYPGSLGTPTGVYFGDVLTTRALEIVAMRATDFLNLAGHPQVHRFPLPAFLESVREREATLDPFYFLPPGAALRGQWGTVLQAEIRKEDGTLVVRYRGGNGFEVESYLRVLEHHARRVVGDWDTVRKVELELYLPDDSTVSAGKLIGKSCHVLRRCGFEGEVSFLVLGPEKTISRTVPMNHLAHFINELDNDLKGIEQADVDKLAALTAEAFRNSRDPQSFIQHQKYFLWGWRVYQAVLIRHGERFMEQMLSHLGEAEPAPEMQRNFVRGIFHPFLKEATVENPFETLESHLIPPLYALVDCAKFRDAVEEIRKVFQKLHDRFSRQVERIDFVGEEAPPAPDPAPLHEAIVEHLVGKLLPDETSTLVFHVVNDTNGLQALSFYSALMRADYVNVEGFSSAPDNSLFVVRQGDRTAVFGPNGEVISAREGLDDAGSEGMRVMWTLFEGAGNLSSLREKREIVRESPETPPATAEPVVAGPWVPDPEAESFADFDDAPVDRPATTATPTAKAPAKKPETASIERIFLVDPNLAGLSAFIRVSQAHVFDETSLANATGGKKVDLLLATDLLSRLLTREGIRQALTKLGKTLRDGGVLVVSGKAVDSEAGAWPVFFYQRKGERLELIEAEGLKIKFPEGYRAGLDGELDESISLAQIRSTPATVEPGPPRAAESSPVERVAADFLSLPSDQRSGHFRHIVRLKLLGHFILALERASGETDNTEYQAAVAELDGMIRKLKGSFRFSGASADEMPSSDLEDWESLFRFMKNDMKLEGQNEETSLARTLLHKKGGSINLLTIAAILGQAVGLKPRVNKMVDGGPQVFLSLPHPKDAGKVCLFDPQPALVPDSIIEPFLVEDRSQVAEDTEFPSYWLSLVVPAEEDADRDLPGLPSGLHPMPVPPGAATRPGKGPRNERGWFNVESLLAASAATLTGDPVFGLAVGAGVLALGAALEKLVGRPRTSPGGNSGGTQTEGPVQPFVSFRPRETGPDGQPVKPEWGAAAASIPKMETLQLSTGETSRLVLESQKPPPRPVTISLVRSDEKNSRTPAEELADWGDLEASWLYTISDLKMLQPVCQKIVDLLIYGPAYEADKKNRPANEQIELMWRGFEAEIRAVIRQVQSNFYLREAFAEDVERLKQLLDPKSDFYIYVRIRDEMFPDLLTDIEQDYLVWVYREGIATVKRKISGKTLSLDEEMRLLGTRDPHLVALLKKLARAKRRPKTLAPERERRQQLIQEMGASIKKIEAKLMELRYLDHQDLKDGGRLKLAAQLKLDEPHYLKLDLNIQPAPEISQNPARPSRVIGGWFVEETGRLLLHPNFQRIEMTPLLVDNLLGGIGISATEGVIEVPCYVHLANQLATHAGIHPKTYLGEYADRQEFALDHTGRLRITFKFDENGFRTAIAILTSLVHDYYKASAVITDPVLERTARHLHKMLEDLKWAYHKMFLERPRRTSMHGIASVAPAGKPRITGAHQAGTPSGSRSIVRAPSVVKIERDGNGGGNGDPTAWAVSTEGNLALSAQILDSRPQDLRVAGMTSVVTATRGGDDVKTKLVRIAHNRGLDDIARFLSRLSDEQIVALARNSKALDRILERTGLNNAVLPSRAKSVDRLLIALAFLSSSQKDLDRLGVVSPQNGGVPSGLQTSAILRSATVTTGAPTPIFSIVR